MRSKAPIPCFRQDAVAFWLGHSTGALQRWTCALVCLAAASVLAWVALRWQAEHQALSQARERVQQQRAQFMQRKPPPKVTPVLLNPRDVLRHNAAVAQLNTPWSDIFDGLERRAQADVGLILLEPDTKKGTLRVQAEAKEIDRLIAYAQRVAADAAFAQLTLQQHETNEQDPNRPVRLSFDVRLAPASAGFLGAGTP